MAKRIANALNDEELKHQLDMLEIDTDICVRPRGFRRRHAAMLIFISPLILNMTFFFRTRI